MASRTCFCPSGVYTAAAAFWIAYATPLNLVDWRRNQSSWRLTGAPVADRPMSSFGTTVKAQRVPVKPAVFEKLLNSMATSRAVHPDAQGVAAKHGAGRVVRVAEVDEVHGASRQRRAEAVLRSAGQINEPAVTPRLVGPTRAAGHHVTVDVHGVHRVREGHHAIGGED